MFLAEKGPTQFYCPFLAEWVSDLAEHQQCQWLIVWFCWHGGDHTGCINARNGLAELKYQSGAQKKGSFLNCLERRWWRERFTFPSLKGLRFIYMAWFIFMAWFIYMACFITHEGYLVIWAWIKLKKCVVIGMKPSPLSCSQGSFIIFIFFIKSGSKDRRKNYFGKLLRVCVIRKYMGQ